MPHFGSPKNEITQNMNEISSDFACLKVSALGKASRISGEIDRITIGPDSTLNNECEKSENIENEQNSCNIKSPSRIADSQNNKIATNSGITFSMKKILLEIELQRKEEVQKEIERHWQHMKQNGKAIQEHMARSRSTMAEERERASAEKLATILAEEERIAYQEEMRRKQEQQLQAQHNQEQKQKLAKEVEEYRRKMKEKELKEKEELYKKIKLLRNEFRTIYCNIVLLSKGCKDKNSVAILLSSYDRRLKEICLQSELINKKIKNGELIPADLPVAENVVQNITEILSSIKTEIERIDEQYEATIAASISSAPEIVPENAPERSEQQNSENCMKGSDQVETIEQTQVQSSGVSDIKIPSAPSAVSEQPSLPTDAASLPVTTTQQESDLYRYVDKESLQIYISSKQYLENYVKSYDEFLKSPSTKKFRFECQKAINIPVNAISAVSEQHLRDKYDRLSSLLLGNTVPNVLQHPQGVAFCKDVLAKKIVSQGETLVSSKPKMAFGIAAIAVALWNDHADFGELLLAHFRDTCPFIVPVFIPKTEGQSDEEYYRSMGYKYDEDGAVEKHDKFLKRMSGVMRLYASITITAQRSGIQKSHPHGLQHAWRWLAAILNTEPRTMITDLCATLILDMLEVAGNGLWVAYPKQFQKLLLLLSEDYYPRMQNVGSIGGGPLVRLEEFLKNTWNKRSIPPSEGQLPPNFW